MSVTKLMGFRNLQTSKRIISMMLGEGLIGVTSHVLNRLDIPTVDITTGYGCIVSAFYHLRKYEKDLPQEVVYRAYEVISILVFLDEIYKVFMSNDLAMSHPEELLEEIKHQNGHLVGFVTAKKLTRNSDFNHGTYPSEGLLIDAEPLEDLTAELVNDVLEMEMSDTLHIHAIRLAPLALLSFATIVISIPDGRSIGTLNPFQIMLLLGGDKASDLTEGALQRKPGITNAEREKALGDYLDLLQVSGDTKLNKFALGILDKLPKLD